MGIVEKKTETTIVAWGKKGIMEQKLEHIGLVLHVGMSSPKGPRTQLVGL